MKYCQKYLNCKSIMHRLNALTLMSLIVVAGAIPEITVAQDLSSERQQELKHMLKHDCGSCHGMTMLGGLGPALNTERMQKFPVEFIELSIMHGRPGTPMPPWKPFLTKAEAKWLAHEIRGDNQ